MATEHTPIPWQLGNATGHNANIIYADGGEKAICEVYGLPMHTRVDKVDSRWIEGLKTAQQIVTAVNAHAKLVEALKHIRDDGMDAGQCRAEAIKVLADAGVEL